MADRWRANDCVHVVVIAGAPADDGTGQAANAAGDDKPGL